MCIDTPSASGISVFGVVHDERRESRFARSRFGTTGTLLQVLELLLAVRASTSGGDSRLFEPADSAASDPAKKTSPARVGSAVLRLLWLADPAKSRCPPVRYAMLQVLEVGHLRAKEGGVAAMAGAKVAMLRIYFVHDENSHRYPLSFLHPWSEPEDAIRCLPIFFYDKSYT